MRFGFSRSAAAVAALAVLFCLQPLLSAQGPFGAPSENSAFSIPQAQLIQPSELNSALGAAGAEKPIVLQVGSRVLFAQAHIAGSEYAGAGSQPEGLQQLEKRVSRLPRQTPIILYCGCCPWNRCPNVGPAFRRLQSLGFTHVKALYIANNLGTDWVDKGFPVERSR
jgi:rhodanese-related sulfurtransferase